MSFSVFGFALKIYFFVKKLKKILQGEGQYRRKFFGENFGNIGKFGDIGTFGDIRREIYFFVKKVRNA